MDEKLSEFRGWLEGLQLEAADDSDMDMELAYAQVIDEFDERFGA